MDRWGILELLPVPAKPIMTRTISDMPHTWNHDSGISGPVWQKDNDTKAYPLPPKIQPEVSHRGTGWIWILGGQG